ncbi:MAG: hypothetical protein NVS9B14_18550 [Candidatus Acidiferrum sp.]
MRDDWRAWLPESKARLNDNCSRELETLYNMLSISLNEAIGLRKQGLTAKACDAVDICRGICLRFSQALEAVLNGLHDHAKHFPIVPNAAPLDPDNFRGSRSQRTAKYTGLLNRVLLSQRSQFIHKASTLREMVLDLRDEFCRAVDDLVSGIFYRTEALWAALDQCHFDLNTCLRETMVLLKSFFVVLPEEQLAAFESSLRLPAIKAEPKLAFRHRRFAAVPGK